MKKAGFVVIVMWILVSACGDNSSSTRIKIDSIGKRFDTSAERLWDSTKEKAKEIKEKIDNKLDQKDSASKKADNK
jgi:Skp family chaperone for outer membrane proteins